jgi:hypothetical protein
LQNPQGVVLNASTGRKNLVAADKGRAPVSALPPMLLLALPHPIGAELLILKEAGKVPIAIQTHF